MVTIDIVLKIGDCEKQMPMDEARNLYHELGRLFNGGNSSIHTKTPFEPVRPYDILDEGEEITPDMHPKVQAARRAAKEKTGGCTGCGGGNKKQTNTRSRTSTKDKG